jgi:hypothetical protein
LAGGVGVGVGEPVGVGVGVPVGVAVGDGVGVGEVNAFPSNAPGFDASGAFGRDVVAFELKAIQRPSLLITGRVFRIITRTLSVVAGKVVLKRTLLVSVI